MRVRDMRKEKWKTRNRNKKNEKSILKKIDTLPYELVGEIFNYLPLHVQNIIKPLENSIDAYDLIINYYWINFHLYFYDFFNKRDLESKLKLKKYFDRIKDIKYVRFNKKFYKIDDKELEVKLKEFAEMDVLQFQYDSRQHENNVKNRTRLSKTKEEIEVILSDVSIVFH